MPTIEQNAKNYFLKELKNISEREGVDNKHAFLLWICEKILKIPDISDAEEAASICGDLNHGIDIFHIEDNGDEIDQYVCWAQVKFSEGLDLEIGRDDIELFVNTIEALEDQPPDASSIFKQKAQDFADIEKTNASIRKRMLLVVTGNLTSEARTLINDEEWKAVKIENMYGQSIELDVLDLKKILSYITTYPTPMLQIKFDGDIITRIDSVTQKQSIMGYVSGNEIVKITKKHNTIFLENPREFLGSTSTNKAIRNILSDDKLRKKFWKLNNGITAICDNFIEVYNEKNAYDVMNFKIVNGRQTTYSLEKFSSSLDDVFLFLGIHEASDDQERAAISEATNTQNPIKRVDLITNSVELRNLELECRREFSDFYFERQTNGFKAESRDTQRQVTPRRVLSKNSTARSYYAYAIDPNGAMKSENEFFNKTSTYCDHVFKNRTIRELIISHIFMDMIKSLHAKWRGDETHEIERAIIGKKKC